MLSQRVGLARGLVTVSLGITMVLAACGGESHSPGHGSLSGSGAGANDEPDVPRLNGVPTGDCHEFTDDERVALGCPASPPEEGAPCDLAPSVSCPYSLLTDGDTSYQNLYRCSNEPDRHWWLLQEQCGELCSDGYPQVLDLQAADCTSRALDSCELAGAEPGDAGPARTLLSDALMNVIHVCGPDAENFGVTLELDRGCPTRFSTNYDFSQTALDCIREKLESKRYACGELLPCVEYSGYFL